MKTKQLIRKIQKLCGGRHCFCYCSWPLVKQKSQNLIGSNHILLCSYNSSQISLAKPGTVRCSKTEFEWHLKGILEV